ncbi:MAG: replication protein RepA, partial [Terriglobia bacterium]
MHFQTAAEMLDFFHLSKDGRHYRRIVEGFQRVFAATIFFGTEDQPAGNRMTDCARFHFFEHMRLWFSDTGLTHRDDETENVIELTDSFFQEINQHRIPVEREVIAALANAPGLLDFYVWLAWKSWSLRGHSVRIPLLGPAGLSQQLGTAPYAVERTFRLTVSRWLRTVGALWPQ